MTWPKFGRIGDGKWLLWNHFSDLDDALGKGKTLKASNPEWQVILMQRIDTFR